MSITDPNADDVQAPEAQGDAGTSDAPYAEYLNRIPEQLRGDVEPVFKEWDSNVGRKFQEHADYRKQWERYEPTGVNQYDPEAVAWAMQFYEAHQNNPQAVVDYVKGYAEQNGIPFGTQPAEQTPGTFDEFSGFQDPQQLQTLIDQATGPLKQQLEQMQGHIEQQQQAQKEAQANQFIDGQVAELEQKHKVKFVDGKPEKPGEVSREVLHLFAGKYIESDAMNAISRGFDEMMAFSNHIEKGALQAKLDAPAPAEGGGIPDVNPTKYSRVDDPNVRQQAIDMLRNNRG